MRCAVEERFSKSLQCTRGRWKRAGGAGKRLFSSTFSSLSSVWHSLAQKKMCVCMWEGLRSRQASALCRIEHSVKIYQHGFCVSPSCRCCWKPTRKMLMSSGNVEVFKIHSIWIQGKFVSVLWWLSCLSSGGKQVCNLFACALISKRSSTELDIMAKWHRRSYRAPCARARDLYSIVRMRK